MNSLPIVILLLALFVWSGCDEHLSPTEVKPETGNIADVPEPVNQSQEDNAVEENGDKGMGSEEEGGKDTVQKDPLSLLQSDILTYLTQHPGNPRVSLTYSGPMRYISSRVTTDGKGGETEQRDTSEYPFPTSIAMSKSDMMRVQGDHISFSYSLSSEPGTYSMDLYVNGNHIDRIAGGFSASYFTPGMTVRSESTWKDLSAHNVTLNQADTGFSIVITGVEVEQYIGNVGAGGYSSWTRYTGSSNPESSSMIYSYSRLPANSESRLEITIK